MPLAAGELGWAAAVVPLAAGGLGELQKSLAVAANGLVVIGGHQTMQKIRAGVVGGALSPNEAWGSSQKIRAEVVVAVLAP